MRLLLAAILALCPIAGWTATAAKARPATSALPAPGFSRSTALPSWAEPLDQVPPAPSDEPVVVRLAETQYWAGPNPAYLVNRAVQVNSSSRLSEIGQFAIDFAPAYQKLVLHRIAILRGNQVLDRTQSADVRVVAQEAYLAASSYLGLSSAKVLLEDVMPGDTLWMTYTLEGRNPVLGANWAELVGWTKAEPVESRKLMVAYPAARALHWRVSGLPRPGLPAPAIEQRGGITRMTFRERAIAADEVEGSLPPNLVPLPVLDFSEFKDWAEVAQWAVALFPDASGQPQVREFVRQFAGATPEERASQALHWVQDNVRYFSVSIGQNSHRPQPPDVVLKRRFGDCKDKSQLLVSLYRAMGLQAQPVLVNATSPAFPAQFLPSPGSFDHVVVRVQLDGKVYFVDPTRHNERGPISRLPGAVPGAAGLVVDRATASLAKLPEETIEQPLVERTEHMTIATLRGNAQLQVRTEYRGRFAAPMRDAWRAMGSADIRKALLAEVERTYPGITLAGTPSLSDSADGTSFIVDAQLAVPTPLKDDAGHFKLPLRSHVMEGTLGMPDKLVRKHPLWLAAGRYRARYNLDVSLPAEARLVQQDDNFAVDTGHLAAHAQLTWRGAHLDYYLDYAITSPEVAPAELPALAAEVEKLNPLYENTLRFAPLAIPPRTAKDASLRVLDIMSRLDDYEDLQIEAVATGKVPQIKLDDATLAKLDYRALCEQALGALALRAWNPMLAAPAASLLSLVETRSDKRTRELCFGRRKLFTRDFRRSSNALAELAPPDADPLTLTQAWIDYYAGDSARASANLTRHLKASSAAGALNAHDATTAFALARRLDLPEPPEVRALVQALRPDAWPMPMFRLLRSELAPEDLLKAVDRLPPAAREYANLEAHFAISQAYLSRHEPRRADLHVNWLLRHALVGSEYQGIANADRFADVYADPDAREALGLEEQSNSSRNTTIRHWKAAAERGVAFAQFKLATEYVRGRDVRTDIPKAIELFQAAAAKGLGEAMNDLANVYIEANGVPRDDQRGLALYRQAVEYGNEVAAYNLARRYWFGQNGVAIDPEKAFDLFRASAEMGDSSAQFFLSILYFQGRGTEKNDVLARFWAGQSALRDDPDGAAQLGLVLMQTELDTKMREAGLHLIERQMRNMNSFARLELGQLLLDGRFITADPAKAFLLVEMAAKQRHDRAQALLGRMYVEGVGVKADRAKGMAMLTEQAKDGLPEAEYYLGYLYRSDTAGMTDKAKAVEWLRRAAGKGYPDAAESLAVMLHTGEGVPTNLPEAARYYEAAARAGRPRAMNNLANMYENGQGVTMDLHHAMELYRQAANLGNTMAMLNLAELYEAGAEQAPRLVPLAYVMLAKRLGDGEADDAVRRLQSGQEPGTIAKAQAFTDKWKPGTAMPEDAWL